MRSHRKRSKKKKCNVTLEKSSNQYSETIRLLRKDNARLRRQLREALEKIPKPEITFPVAVRIGRWVKIKSTTSLTPGKVLQFSDDDEYRDVILEKKGLSVVMQSLRDGKTGTLSIYDAKANWKINTRACLSHLVQLWKER
jgi:hypothetical protein